jgi:hypothetical protein
MPVRVVVQHGPRDKKVAAVAIDWPGWSRGARTAGDAVDTLDAYRERYRPVAHRAGLATELDAAGDLEVVEDHVGVGSTDYWGISFAPSSFEHGPMTDDELDRKLGLLEAAWSHFDEVAARVSAEMAKGPRGGGRDRDQIIRHVLLNEQADLARKVGVETPVDALTTSEGLRIHRERFLAAIREHGAEGRMARGRNWTIALLIRHTAYHALDHAWEMEDRDLSW